MLAVAVGLAVELIATGADIPGTSANCAAELPLWQPEIKIAVKSDAQTVPQVPNLLTFMMVINLDGSHIPT